MQWTAYEIFSVISGLILIGAAFAPGLSLKYRAYAVLGGAFFTGYGFYVANQASGTYEFPVFIFVIPAVAVLYLLYRVFGGTGGSSAG
ncbi:MULTISPECIES: hypothetical protein [unclassified Streptomyces]|uniref:Integral membrane protein n=2 Tax=Streptomyces TaxID=1883 RepID=A0ABU2RFZ9_9ACTN|nr:MULTISPECIES: hypothetical protein [unclassified Streptomyces]HBF79679.1 hypothetical protein [Streptomyces sp.]AEN11310.1 hypothetical protein SACTE_3453 [Streptomyces sp. SirexAA-E]MBK3593911.1 hypothetical protein [Streptomyces sp. MBT51]MDT0427427.1 hypothetical protein [Streptomyces sp. DSM 41770]MYR67569.1 hypothetical protein [Streptomyces sp. SID4939]